MILFVLFTVQENCSRSNAVRLTQFSSSRYGRLEICVGGVWGTVCGNGATSAIADVACRELNHAATGLGISHSKI